MYITIHFVFTLFYNRNSIQKQNKNINIKLLNAELIIQVSNVYGGTGGVYPEIIFAPPSHNLIVVRRHWYVYFLRF